MKRIVYTRIGGPDSIEIISEKLEQAVENEVKVRVYRAGINFADLMMRQGLYGSNPDFPFTPGYDCLLYTSPSPRDQRGSRMPSSA